MLYHLVHDGNTETGTGRSQSLPSGGHTCVREDSRFFHGWEMWWMASHGLPGDPHVVLQCLKGIIYLRG